MRFPSKGMGWKEFGVALKDELTRDYLTDWAGAVTYSAVMALFPFLLFLLALASFVITPEQAETLVQQLSQVAPHEVTKIVGDRIRAIASEGRGDLLTVGAAVALWSASSGMAEVQRALNIVYGVREERPFWKARGIALLMTLLTCVIAITAAGIAIASPAVASAIGGPIGTLIVWLRLPVAGLLMMFLWAVLYFALPDVEQKFKFITPGSVMGVIVWLIASWGFSIYVSSFGRFEATYGSVGGIIVMLLWMWISSLVLLFGAEVNAIIEHKSEEGKRAGAKRMADSGRTDTKGKEQRSGDHHLGADPAAAMPRGRVLAVLAAFVGAALWLKRREAS